MGSAAPAYQYRYEQAQPLQRETRVRVVPGNRQQKTSSYLSRSAILLVQFFAAALVVFTLLGFVRIGIASATVTTELGAEEVSAKIESARSFGNELAVRESYLSNPAYLKTEASKLMMCEPAQNDALYLADDVIKTDSEGQLSLSLSLRAIAQR
ncbi:MAG: cell division protein FtsL [Eggerthellaceae bacterium]|nr:cell division protein FtsL [Eggerthellaceae bacterium]